jgi:hypothetical protein
MANIKYGYSLIEIADQLGCHYSTLSKIINAARRKGLKG